MSRDPEAQVRDALAALPSDYLCFGERDDDAAQRGGRFLLYKPATLIERYLDLADEFRGGRVVEVGVYQGGSTIFLTELLQPRKLVAVEIESAPVEALASYVREHDLDDVVRVHYGVDQADRATVAKIIDEEFGDEPLDLVIDDASHLLRETTTTMEVLFPRLRPGGVYVIEDWSANLAVARSRVAALTAGDEVRDEQAFSSALQRRWSQDPDLMQRLEASPEFGRRLSALGHVPQPQGDDGGRVDHAAGRQETQQGEIPEVPDEAGAVSPSGDHRAGVDGVSNTQMWRLIVDLLSIVASTDVIDDLQIRRGIVVARRGSADLDAETFRLTDLSHLAMTGFSRGAQA